MTERDRSRIGDVFEKHRGFVEAVAVREVGRQEAGDVVAEVGLRLCQGWRGIRDPGLVRTWIYRVTINVSRDAHAGQVRQDRIRARLEQLPTPPPVCDPDAELLTARRREAFDAALERLKSRDKRLICDSLQAEPVSGTNGADRMALSRARQRFAECLRRDRRLWP